MAWRSWGDGPALALFHGGAGSWRHWAHNIDVLSREYRLLVPDLPGLAALAGAWPAFTRPGCAAGKAILSRSGFSAP